MIRKFYDIMDESVGGEEKPTAPANYKTTTPQQRSEWNSFLDYAGKKNVDFDKDPKVGANLMTEYKKTNPSFSLTPNDLQRIQYEHYQLRKGGSFGSLKPEQLKYLRQGLPESYLNRPVDTTGIFTGNTAKLYYPQKTQGDRNFDTDIEGYINSKYGVVPINADKTIDTAKAAGPAPTTIGAPINRAPVTESNPNLIARPDYNNQASRNNFLQQWSKKYGDLQGRGDTILKLNEVPRGGRSTEEQIATDAAKKFGIDPALLHVSAFEEGASELFKDKSGLDTKHRKPTDFGYMGDYGDKQYPINGNNSFGLPDFAKRFPDLVAGGYLPKSFQSQFRGLKNAGEFSENNFKSPEDAMTAKAALMKYGSDYVEKVAKKNGVELSPKQKDFFTLAWFNGGEGAVLSRIPKYKSKGYLKDDSFLDKRPEEEKGKPDNLDVWGHVVPRIKRRDALKEQNFFK